MITIGDKEIHNGKSVFIIAEAGVNHNGDINIAKRLIDEAKIAGVDAIKFQTYKTENLVTSYADMAQYQKNNIGKANSQYNMLKKLEISFDDFILLKAYAEKVGILFLSTPFDIESADFLESIDIKAYKISSGDLTNIPLLEHISTFNKPIILSSGMSTLEDIEDGLNAIYKCGNKSVAVLHCTSNYPATIESVNLKAMDTINNIFGVTTGYSDHTEGITIPIAAASRGAAIIEKHFTLDKNMDGPDHKASLDIKELREMVSEIRKIDKALGNGIKTYTEGEVDTIKAARKSIVAKRNINIGDIIKMEDLDFKRPGNGMMPKYYSTLIGKKASRNICKDEQIAYHMIQNNFENY